ncbi:uncharacterized protein LOC112548353 [Alligator sinensis]|uniref:Uncharacterized protein LOC112548353 n=1 Tax=Alligator sinensis TaxID=38654 RepID=A0A3Q0FVD0_ALLSI|nr:uncharacterized protein LOC112548353 [Alligator sinensis]
MHSKRRSWDWTQCWNKINALRCAFHQAKDEHACSGAGHIIASFYNQLSIIFSKDVGEVSCFQLFGTGIILESTPKEGASQCPEMETMNILEQWGNCSMVLDERDTQEEMTLIMTPISPPILLSSTDEEEQEDTTLDMVPHQRFLQRRKEWFLFPRCKKIRKRGLLPWLMPAGDMLPNLWPPACTGAECSPDYHHRQQYPRQSMMEALVEVAQTQVATTDDWQDKVWKMPRSDEDREN